MREEEKKEFREKMHLIRKSSLTEEEKKVQRAALRAELEHLLTIYR